MESNVLTRQEFYELVWTEPITSIARKYNVTDHFIRNRCKEMLIPLPGSGYWMKIKHGYKVNREKLPLKYSGKESITLSLDSPTNPLFAKQREILNDKRLNLVVHHNLTDPDPLVVRARESLLRKNDFYRPHDLVFTETGKLCIRVEKEHINRALRLMDTLVKALRARGHDFAHYYEYVAVVIQGVNVGFGLKEHRKKTIIKDTYDRTEYIPTGSLYFDMGESYTDVVCGDSSINLEDKLYKVIAKYEFYAEGLRRTWDENRRREDERKEQERIRQEKQARKQRELDDFKNLLAKSDRRFQTEMIRHYIDLVEKREIENQTLDEARREWIAWARGKADWYDPFIEADDELLRGADRKELTF